MKKNSKTSKTSKAALFVKEAPAKYGAKPAQKPAPAAPAPKAGPMTKEALAARAEEKKAEAAKKAVEAVALAKAVKDAPAKAAPAKAKAEKAPKAPKEKPFTKSMVEVDASAYVKAHDKLPGTGKREPKTLWKFLIGKTPFSFETEFYRTARAAAVEKAVSLCEPHIAVLA